MTGLSVVSQTLCNIEVLPAFALPMMSTLNRTFGARGLEDGVGDGDGAGEGGGPRQQISCFAPIVRKCCEEKDGTLLITRCNPVLVIIHTVQMSADWCACRGMPFHFMD